ncbi:MAG TPA: PLP-dependent aspartate aminotransferase family protein [Turneriella sp.]|nr:PLP-dependent aspartate aminotransferase family protein [Turneriella sp.]HNM99024.1 PLP-dependent aspartate aminotransferase family protein [Turneriella sp.]
MKKSDEKKGLSTRAIHAGHDNSADPHKPIVTPIYQTASYAFDEVEGLWAFYQKRSDRLAEYARYGTPTQRALEETLCALENAEDCVVTSSGMNAIVSAIFGVANAGDHMVSLREGYRGTFKMFDQHLARFGISTSYADLTTAGVKTACTEKTRVIFIEFPTNPYLRLVDLAEITAFARSRGITTIVDATFASPMNINPLEHGVDLVVHSLTKFISGHNDAIAGAVLGSKELIEKVRSVRGLFGSNADAHLCFLVSRGIKSFAVRMREHNRSTLEIAQWLEKHPKVTRVWYPMLESHPDHALAKSYLRGGGGVVSFQVKGKDSSQEAGLAASTALLNSLKIPAIAASLGGVESLIHQPSVMSYHDMDAAARLAAGIPDGLIRYAVGLEDTSDLIADLERGLARL